MISLVFLSVAFLSIISFLSAFATAELEDAWWNQLTEKRMPKYRRIAKNFTDSDIKEILSMARDIRNMSKFDGLPWYTSKAVAEHPELVVKAELYAMDKLSTLSPPALSFVLETKQKFDNFVEEEEKHGAADPSKNILRRMIENISGSYYKAPLRIRREVNQVLHAENALKAAAELAWPRNFFRL